MEQGSDCLRQGFASSVENEDSITAFDDLFRRTAEHLQDMRDEGPSEDATDNLRENLERLQDLGPRAVMQAYEQGEEQKGLRLARLTGRVKNISDGLKQDGDISGVLPQQDLFWNELGNQHTL